MLPAVWEHGAFVHPRQGAQVPHFHSPFPSSVLICHSGNIGMATQEPAQGEAELEAIMGWAILYVTATFLTTKIIVLSPFKDQLLVKSCYMIQFLSK